MLNTFTFLKYVAIFLLTLFVVSFITALLTYLLIRFANGLYPKEAYVRGLKSATISEEWAMAAYVLGISFLTIKLLYFIFHLNDRTAGKIRKYMLVVFLVFIGFGYLGWGVDWRDLYTYIFLTPLLTGAFLLVIVEGKLTKWFFQDR